jgi:hypothetical protein
MLEAADHRRRQQRQAFAVRLGDQISHDRHLRDIVAVFPDHALEAVPHGHDLGEREVDTI